MAERGDKTGGEKLEKRVLVMKYIENDHLLYCRENLLVYSAEGKNFERTWLFQRWRG